MDEPKAKVGRPTVYKPEYCQMLIDHMAKGLSFEAFGAIAEVSKETLYQWTHTHEEFSDAKRIATNKCRYFWENLGVEYIVSRTESEKNGPSQTTSSKSLNSAVWVYNMKCRFRDEWTEKTITENTNKNIEIKIDSDDKDL